MADTSAQVNDSAPEFMPHGHCYLWQPALLSVHVGADAIIFLSYLSISMTAVFIVTRIKEVPFHAIYFLFGTFIFACGLTHLLEIWNVWVPAYWVSAAVKVITALASLGTAIILPLYFKKIRDLARAPQLAEEERARREKTELETERQLIQSAKMSSLGEMAGGIAHEINNPLTVILGRTAMMRHHLDSGKSDPAFLATNLQHIERTGARIDNIVRGMRGFCRQGEGDALEEVKIDTIISDTVTLCQERFNTGGVELRAMQTGATSLMCHPTQISQVLLNLLNNAFDAVAALDHRWVEISVTSTLDELAIHVTDSGINIDPEIARKIMQPFFTTKEAGKGTGLGLSISKSLVERHGGRLVHDPTSPTTKFTVRLPAAVAKIQVA